MIKNSAAPGSSPGTALQKEGAAVLNYLWAFMLLAGILWAAFHGTMAQVTQGALDAAGEAVSLCITMTGVLSLWSGILEIGQQSGLLDQLADRMNPILRFLFPRLPANHPAGKAMAVNMIANLLGLGWAATPAGLQAMKELKQLEEERRAGIFPGPAAAPDTASREMCTFLIINISSLQLIPINMIAYRSQYGIANPAAITGPALLATAVSTAAAVVFCRLMEFRRE